MNAHTVSDMNPMPASVNGARSMNSYLQHQSRKSAALFEGSAGFGDVADANEEWSRMEERLKRTRERIEKAVVAMKLASANAAQFDDEDGFSTDDSVAKTTSLARHFQGAFE